MKFDSSVFREYGIEFSAVISVSEMKIINFRRLNILCRALFPRCAVIFLVPYFTGKEDCGNISKYAVSRDYHIYMKELSQKLCPELEKLYGKKFYGMADSSPYDEVSAAAYTGLGIIGDNRLLINEKYGSYVFIGAFYTDAVFECSRNMTAFCNHCGACGAACPDKNRRRCLSLITQKKGLLTAEEEEYIKKYGSVWGCDICSDSCPHNVNAAITPIEFFHTQRIPHLTSEILNNMTDSELAKRAFGWRGRAVIERNCRICENNPEYKEKL